MEIQRIENIIEAVLFASGEPMSAEKIAGAIEIDKNTVTKVITNMLDTYSSRGIELIKLDKEYQLCTKAEYFEYIKKAMDNRKNSVLSNAAIEILSIIAYNGPVTKSYVEKVRGVDCSGTINTLAQKGLIEECGRLDAPGRPLLFRVSADFFRVFGISSLDELPKLPERDIMKLENATQMSIEDSIDIENIENSEFPDYESEPDDNV